MISVDKCAWPKSASPSRACAVEERRGLRRETHEHGGLKENTQSEALSRACNMKGAALPLRHHSDGISADFSSALDVSVIVVVVVAVDVVAAPAALQV